MNADELLALLAEREVTLTVAGDELVVRGQKAALDHELVSLLRENKQLLVDRLQGRAYVDAHSGIVEVPLNVIAAGATTITPAMLPLVELSEAEIERVVETVAGGARNVQDIYPLAPLQEGILFHHLLARDGDPYLLRSVQRFDSRARLDAFVAALQAVIDRHDILRTAVVWEGLREPVQVVWRQAPLVVEEVACDVAAGDAIGQLAARFDPRHYRLEVQKAPLFRVAVARDVTADRWIMVLMFHHLVSDHMALEVILQELEAHLRGAGAQLPRSLPFRNFVAQARFGVSREEHESFFAEMLGDVDEPTAPFGLTDVQGDGSGIAQAERVLDASLSKRVREQARVLGVSTASMCHLAWARVLGALSGRDDVVFGTVLFGRMQVVEGSDRSLGLLINTLPLRLRLGEDGVKQGVRRTHDALAELMRHEHASLALAQRCSAVVAPAPLFSALLNYRHLRPADPAADAKRAWEGIEFLGDEERTNYPLTLSVNDYGDALGLTAQVVASIDPERICAYMQTVLEHLVDALDRAPRTPVCELDVLPASERRRIVTDWNATEAAYPADRCIHELFEEQAANAPGAVAVIFEDTRLTYGDLDAQANRLARYLRSVGVGPDTRVALCVERSVEMVVGLLAVLKAGGAYVPLDPSYPRERLRYMLADSAPLAVLTHGAVPGSVQEVLRASGVAVIDLQRDAAGWAGESPSNLDRAGLTPEHLAYVIYTSGTAGHPKGVMNAHRAVVNRLCWSQAVDALGPHDRVLQKTPFSFDVSVWEFFWPLLSGARLVMARAEGHRDPGYLAEVIDAQQITTVHFVPSMVRAFLDVAEPERCASVRRVLCSGEALSGSLVQLLQECLPGAEVSNLYGPTEAAVEVTAWRCRVGPQPESTPIGRPIHNARIYILDARAEPVPIGVAGELHIGGVPVARGYVNRPELTAERFVPSPFVAGDRLYKTGDLARYLPDGTIEYLGRNDFQVKLRGFRIELAEIEARLGEHERVRDVVVVAREDVPGEKRLVAYYTLRGAGDVRVEDLRSHVLGVLPEYMVPAAYVRMEALPLTPSGKLDRKALPAPEGSAYVVRAYEAPLGAVEQTIARIWSEVLDVEGIGRHDNFFELGGHSLSAIRALSRMRLELQVQLGLTHVFASPTLREIARAVTGATVSLLPAMPRADRDGALVLSFAQQRLWFLAHMEGASEAYHIPLGLHLRGELDREALRKALDALVARHEPLRTTFAVVDGKPLQRIAPVRSGFSLMEHDLRARARQAEDLAQLRLEETTAAFDLGAGPLIRGRLIALADTEHVLLITMHHIVSDGWSMGVLLGELSALYRGYHENAPAVLPALEIQYADYAAWQREHLGGAVLHAQIAYWRQALAGVPEIHQLPTDRPRPAQQDHRGDYVRIDLDAELTGKLRALSRAHGTTLFTTLLTVWGMLLGRLSGENDVVVGTPVANRQRTEIEGLIGLFVNTLALRLDLSGSPSVSELLDRVALLTLAAQEHQDVPFEQVVDVIAPLRSLGHTPLFQVAFAWQNSAFGELDLPGLHVAGVAAPIAVAKFDLTLNLAEARDRITGNLEYATALFDRSTIERYAGYLRTLLTAAVADEGQSIARLAVLPEAERRQLVVDWNATEARYPSDRCIHELFEERAAQAPGAVAVVHGDAQLTYGELNAQANRLARHLRSVGVRPGACVAICVPRSMELVVSELAVLKCGAVYVPLDENAPAERQRFMLDDCQARIVLSLADLKVSSDGDVQRVDVDRVAFDEASENIAAPVDGESTAYIMYTSGSTGAPKGVLVPHRAIGRLVLNNGYADFGADDRVAFAANPAFDASTMEVWGPLLNGGRIVVVDRDTLLDASRFAALIEQQCVTVLFVTTALFNQYAAAIPLALSRLRVLLCGGEKNDPGVFARLLQAGTGPQHLVHCYGPTETTTFAMTYEVAEVPDDTTTIPIGRPISNTSIYIVDGYDEPVPIGVAGELCIGGAGVARGYLNRPELTAERFVPSPFVAGDRLYKTGDLARFLPDGNVEYLGRNDFQVKIRGFRIELGEIEARLRDHERLRDVVVLAREDVPGEKRLVAYYTLRDAGEVSVEELRSRLLRTLPEYMVPAAYVSMQALPLTPNGKVDRNALSAPDAMAYRSQTYEAPVGEVEATLARIWCEILKLERVSRNASFFELGGHSLLAVDMIGRLRKAGFDVDVRSVFSSPRLDELALAARRTSDQVELIPPNLIPPGSETITPDMLSLVQLTAEEIERVAGTVSGGARNVQDIYPLAPLQEGLLFHHLLASETDPYAVREFLHFANRAELDRYTSAFQVAIDRHDIYRTAFAWEGLSEPVQVVWRQARLVVDEIDVDQTAGDVPGQLAARCDPRQYRIDVTRAPLIRIAAACERKTGAWFALRVSHDLVFDRFSSGLMDGEIRAQMRGDQLPEPVPFRNVIARMRSGVSREEHEAFFREMLGDVEEPCAPFGLIDVDNDGVSIVHGYQVVDASLVTRLRAQTRAFGVSVASLCHLAWGRVLAAASGRDEAVFGTVLFGRAGDEDAGRAMGLFLNTLPLRVRGGSEAVPVRARQTHDLLARLMRHEHASLALAQRCSAVAAPTPLFGALLNFRNLWSLAESLKGERLAQWLSGLESSEQRTSGAYYPLMLDVDDLGDVLLLAVRVRAPLDAKRICGFMHTVLAELADAMEFAPATPMQRIGVLSEDERRQIVVDWNATEAPYPSDRCIHELFERQVAKAPGAVAAVYEDAQLTYGELNAQANRLARHLRSAGVGPDARVALCVERSLAMLVGLLAVLKAGGAYVPLDPSYPVERLKYMLEDSSPLAVLTHGAISGSAQEMLRASGVAVIDLQRDATRWESELTTNLDRSGLTPAHLAYVIYTSGSTGQPKGVMVEHRNLTNYVAWATATYSPDDGSFVSSSIAFDATVTSIFVPLNRGSAVRLLPEKKVLETLEARVVGNVDSRLIKITPTHLDALGRQLAARSLPGTGVLVIGGESLSASTANMWRGIGPALRLVNEYGPTEATVGCVAYELPHELADSALVPIGRPIWNTRIYLLDGHGEPAPIGVAGELYIGGAGVARGYLNRPELTAERFVPNPFVAGDRLYKTGDLARYLPDGTIEYLGRNDFQVKLRGFRIELGEIEARLREHDRIREAVVVAREDVPGEQRLVAYYTLRDAGEVSVEDVRAHLLEVLPEYMVPAAYVCMEALPLTPSGKLDRKGLPAPEGSAYVVRAYEAPLGEVEQTIARIWSEVLKIEGIGRHDDFFELGGHSLLALRVLSRMRQELQVELSLTQVFASPILREVAQVATAAAVSLLPAMPRIGRDGPLVLSFAQQRLWFLAQMDGVSQAYHIPLGLRLRGALDRAALRKALDELVARHEPLRTTFAVVDGNPVQRIGAAQSGFSLVEHDLRAHAHQAEDLAQLRFEEATAAFDLEAGPLIRGRLIELADSEHVLLITMHHIVSDGWSMGVLLGELSALYRGFRENAPAVLPALEIQYADYAAWQREHVSGAVLQEQIAYWQQALAGIPEVHRLPTDRARPAQQDHAGGNVRIDFDAELTGKLRALSRAHGTTLFTTLLTAWGILLGRLSGDEDVVVGTPVANRQRTEIEGLIGFFINTLTLRLDLTGSPSVSELLDRVKVQTLAAQEHQDVPFEQVVEVVQPPRSLAHTPLFQVVFAWQNNAFGEVAFPGLQMSGVAAPLTVAKFDLTLNLGEAQDRIVGSLEYATALFDRSTVERYVGYLRTLLAAMVGDEGRSIARLGMLSEAERRQLVVDWNATEAAYPSDRCIHELFEAQAAKAPGAVAVVHEDAHLTYGELNARANRLARYLSGAGVRPGACVAICVPRSIELVVAELAVLKCGAVYVPLDENAPAERQRFMLDDCQARIVLGLADLELPSGSHVQRVDVDRVAFDQPSENIPMAADSESAAYVMYTSGSTGAPKGVMVPHRAIGRLVLNNGYADFGADDRVAFAANPAFDASTMEVWGPLLNGGRIVIVDRDTLLDPSLFARVIEGQGITVLWMTASLFSQYAAAIPLALSRLRVLLCGGEKSDPRVFARLLQAGTGPQHLVHCYGPTETTTFAMTYEVVDVPDDATTIPIGRPISNTSVYIVDGHDEPVPIGVAGELYIGGAGVARGYLNRPELTAERFVPSPFVARDRLYKTGDLARFLPDGNVEYLDRNDFQVKIRGFRIELGEIEARLREHEGLRDVVVLAREDVPGEKRLVAYYTTHDAGEVGAEDLRSRLIGALPEYMVPAAYVRMEALPLTPNGKLDRKGLPAPEGSAFVARPYEAPLGEVEQTIARIWSEVLEVEAIGRHDNFFELGGHSLMAVRVLSQMRAAGVHGDIRALFSSPALSSFAGAVSGESSLVEVPPNGIPPGSATITPAMLPLAELSEADIERVVATVAGGARNVQDIYRLAPLQEGILFHHLLTSEGDPYLLRSVQRFDSRARADAFVAALQAVVDRHDILRTAVVWEGLREPVQVVWRRARVVVEEVACDLVAGDVVEHLAARFDPRHYRLDVQQAPLFRVAVARDGNSDRWAMVLLYHHLVSDHMALEVIFEEIEAHLLGAEAQLPKSLPFRNFVAQARFGVSGEEHESFFTEMLGDVAEPTAPFGLTDVQGDGSGIAQAGLVLDSQLSTRLRKQARVLGVSTASMCHVAWARVLGALSGRDDVVFGTVLLGRMHGGEGSDRALGLLMNTLPLRIRVGEGGVRESVRRTHDALAQLMRHEHASLALAQRCSAVVAPAPLFSALLNYRHMRPADASADAHRAWEGIEFLGARERTNYPLILSVNDFGDALGLTAQVVAPVDPGRICAYLRTVLEQLADALERAPNTAVRELDVLPASERRQLVEDWNATEAPDRSERCIHELFEEQAARAPGAVALVCDDAQLTYGELNAQSNRLARYLRGAGVGPDTRVALYLERSLEMVVGLLAVLKAGGAYVPLDSANPVERLSSIVADSAPLAVLTYGAVPEPVREMLHGSGVSVIDLHRDAGRWSREPASNVPRSALTPDHLAYVIYTSGTNGSPAGVMVEHAATCNVLLFLRDAMHIGSADRVLSLTPIACDTATLEIFMALASGARATLLSARESGDASLLADLIADHGATVVQAPSSTWNTLVESGWLGKADLKALCGGEAVPVEIAARLHERVGSVMSVYGPTETTVWSSADMWAFA